MRTGSCIPLGRDDPVHKGGGRCVAPVSPRSTTDERSRDDGRLDLPPSESSASRPPDRSRRISVSLQREELPEVSSRRRDVQCPQRGRSPSRRVRSFARSSVICLRPGGVHETFPRFWMPRSTSISCRTMAYLAHHWPTRVVRHSRSFWHSFGCGKSHRRVTSREEHPCLKNPRNRRN